jgi:Group II intron, maturase-specific domain
MRYVVGSKLHGKNLGRNTNLFITRSFLLFGCLELVASLGIYQSAVTNARFTPVRRESCPSNRSIWQSLWRWAKRRHPHKPSQWVMRKYWHSGGFPSAAHRGEN